MNITKNYLLLYLFLLLGLSPYILNAETTVRVEATSGYWSISSEQQSIKKAFSNLNGKNIFSNAKFTENSYSTNIDGLEVKSSLSIVNHDWCQLAVTVHNPSSDTIFITSFEPFTTDCEDILKGASVENLNIMWESEIYRRGHSGGNTLRTALAPSPILRASDEKLHPQWRGHPALPRRHNSNDPAHPALQPRCVFPALQPPGHLCAAGAGAGGRFC